MCWTNQGNRAKRALNRIGASTKSASRSWSGVPYVDWKPTLTRMNFDKVVVEYVLAGAQESPFDPNDPWYTCAYCKWDYPREWCAVDHIEPWGQHVQTVYANGSLATADTYAVWVAYNNILNLAVACKWCNSSKGMRPLNAAWAKQRKDEADKLGGYGE